MRKVLLTAVLVGLLALPLFAQRGGFGMMGRGMTGEMLLTQASVQKELKLDDKQKEAITEVTKKQMEAFKKAKEDMDFSEIGKAMQEAQKSLAKIRKDLKPAQAKRLNEIEYQQADKNKNAQIFQREDVAKALKLTTKQKDTIKDALGDLEKDQKELFEEAKGDKDKFREVFKKVGKLREETYTKITKSFSEDQKKAWKDLQGEKFEGKLQFGPGGGKGGKKRKDKSDF
jgi:Spy/CpxP family protein refolding chaperone